MSLWHTTPETRGSLAILHSFVVTGPTYAMAEVAGGFGGLTTPCGQAFQARCLVPTFPV